MSQINKSWPFIAVLLALLICAAGCSSSSGGSSNDPDTGKHPDNWIQEHPEEFMESFLSDPAKCEKCHGSDPALRGGISGVSCFNGSCHNTANGAPVLHVLNGVSIKLANWTNPTKHGAAAKSAPTDDSGFAVCQVCHGTRNAPFFGGGVFGPTCFLGCHGPVHSPHPNSWLPDDPFTHSTTDPGNAPVCANCHFHRNNLPADAAALLPPFTPAPNGTAPGCFNSTLCHGVANPHPDGWGSPTVHGPVAKGVPGGTSGFAYCEVCHGVDFNGPARACQDCHGVPAPHPADWLPDDAFTHTTTDAGNAPVCNQCHHNQNNLPADAKALLPPFVPAPAGTPPGCFNNTLCHGAVGIHPSGWSAPAVHGPVAKGAPGPTSGFLYCEACHGTNFNGGTAGVACQSCHGIAAPHPSAWLPGDTFVHTTTNPGNAPVCAQCHRKIDGTPGCFNNTLCHGAVGVHPPGWSAPTVHGPVAKGVPGPTSGFLYCEDCHGTNFSGGSAGVACKSCHGIAAPHPSAWLPGDTFTHTTTDPGNARVCAQCHRQNTGTAGCFNNTLCHGAVGSPHPANWSTPTVHGPVAKAAPGATSGFQYCSVCHGPFKPGGTFNCQTCHGVVAPHPSAWMPDDTYKHNTTNQGNAPVCANCHRKNPGAAGCFNNTLCHGNVDIGRKSVKR